MKMDRTHAIEMQGCKALEDRGSCRGDPGSIGLWPAMQKNLVLEAIAGSLLATLEYLLDLWPGRVKAYHPAEFLAVEGA